MADQEIIQEPIEENAFVPAAQNENAEFVSNEEPNKDLENKNADEPIEQPQSLEPAEARDSEGGMASIIGPPSPLTGCYLLIVIGEPHNSDHKDIILQRLIKGLLSWDLSDNHVDLEEELNTLTCQAIEGEEGKHGERLIQFASENLVTEILIHPQFNTFIQCIRNLLSSFTRHRHIIHSGYTFAGNGSWILQDGTFSVSDFAEAFQDYEVQRVLRAYPDTITMDIHCTANGHWTTISDKNFAKTCKIRINPNNVLNSGSEKLNAFINYLSPMVIPTDITDLLESSDVVGNIRFSHPTLYVFPGGQGDAALFGINGFNMLVDGGFSRKSCFWDFVRHLDRLDAVLMTRINNSNISGLNSVIERKSMAHVYPQIGHFFTNIPDKLSIPSSDSVSNNDPLLIDLIKEGQKTITNLKTLNLKAQHCYRDSEPMNLYHKVGHGTLDMYVISPSKDSKEVKEFIQKWNNNDPKLFATKDAKEFIFPLQNMISICALLIWTPANPEDNVTRILFPGSTPQAKIFEGMDKVKSLEFLKTPVCTVKSLSSSSSTIIMAKKNYKSSISDKNHLDSPKPISKLLECDSKGNDVDNKVIESKSNEITKEDIAQETKKEQNVLKSVPNATKTSKSRTELKRIENKIIKKIDPKDSDGESQEEKKSDEDKKPEKKVEKKEDLDARVTKSKTNRLKTDSKVMARSRIDTKPPKTLSERKPLRKDGIDTTKEIIRSSPPTPKKSSTKSTEDTKLSSSAAPREVKKTVTRTIRASPKNTPGKSTKEANNRKVLESTQKLPHHKREINKQPKNDRKLAPHYAKAMSPQTGSPSKKIKSEKDTIIRKSRTDKNGTTDSSLVSTPSADEAYKRVTEPLEQEVKSEDLEELKEEQEAVREIEAVFQREQIKDVSKKLIAEDHRDIQDSATEADEEDEYLIIEKEDQYTEDSVNDAESSATKEEEIQKLQRDSEESEKRRKGSLEVTEEENEEEALIDEVEKDDGKSEKHKIQKTDELEETDDDGKIVDLPTNNEKPQEIEQIKEILQEQVQEIIVSAKEMAKTKLEAPEVKPDEISSTTPEEKVTSKKTSEKEDDINQQAVSQPEEKFSTNVESGATTTAPTLPEDERCPLDEIKEDLVIEEKHVKENTREKEMLQNTLHRTHEPLERQSPPKLPIQSTVAPHLRDIVKTPDEVADLPVHEEADMDVYEEEHKSTEKELKKLNSKDCDQIDINDEKTETVKLETDVYVKQEDFINKVGEAVEEQILKTDTEVNKLATENENDVALRQNFEKPPSSVDKTIPGSRKSSINDDNANSNQTLSDSRKTLICSSKPSSPDKVESTLTVEIESRDPDTQIVELPVNQTNEDTNKKSQESSRASSPKPETKTNEKLNLATDTEDSNKISSPEPHVEDQAVSIIQEQTPKLSKDNSKVASPSRIDGSKDTQNVPENITKTIEALDFEVYQEKSNKTISPQPEENVSNIHDEPEEVSRPNMKDYKEELEITSYKTHEETKDKPEDSNKAPSPQLEDINRASSPQHEESSKASSLQLEDSVDDKVNLSTETNLLKDSTELPSPVLQGEDKTEKHTTASSKTCEETKDKPEDSNKASSPQPEDINRASSPQHEESSKASSLQLEDSVDDKVNLSTETNLLKDSTEVPSPVLQGEDKTEKHTTASSKTFEETKDKPEDSNKASSPQPEDINRASSPQHEESSKASSLQLEDNVDEKVNLSTETNLLKDSTEVLNPVVQCEDKTEKHTTASYKTHEETKDKPEDSNKAPSPQLEDINRASSPQHEESSKASSLQLEDNVDEKVNLSTETNLLKDSTEVPSPVLQGEDKTEKHTTASSETFEEKKDKSEVSNKASSPQPEDINRASSPQHEESSKASSLQFEDNVNEKVNLSTETNLLKDSTEVPSPVLQGEDKTEKHTTASSETFEEKKDKSEVSNKASSPQLEDINRASSPQHEESSKASSLQLEDNVDEKVNLSTETNLLKDSTEVPSPVLQGEDKTEKHTTASSETFEEKKDKSEVSNKASSPQPEDINRASSPQHEESSKASSLQFEDNVNEKVNLSTETNLLKDSTEVPSPVLQGEDKTEKHTTASSETFEEKKDKSEVSNKASSPQPEDINRASSPQHEESSKALSLQLKDNVDEKVNLSTETHLLKDSSEISSPILKGDDKIDKHPTACSETFEETKDKSEDSNKAFSPQREKENLTTETHLIRDSVEIPSSETQIEDEKETSILESSETHEAITKKSEEPCEATSPESEEPNEVSTPQPEESNQASFTQPVENLEEKINSIELPSADTQTEDEKESSILESSETDEVIMKKPEEPCEATSTESERLNEVSFSQLGESRKNSFQSSEEFKDDEIDKLEMKKETSKACTENESGKNKQDIPKESLQIISPQIEENQDQNKSSLFLERDVNQTQSSEFTICPKTHIETIQIISEINDGVATILGVTLVDSSDKSTEKIHSEVSSPSSNLSTVEQHLKSDTEPNIKLSKMSTDTCISMTSEHIDDIMESENIDDMMESIKNSAHHAVDFTKEDIKQIETEMKEAGEKIIESVKIEVASKVAASEVNSQTFKNEMQKVADEADQAVKKLVESVQAEIVASTNLINEQSQSLEEATKNSLSEKKSLTRTNIEELREELTNTKKEIEDLAKQTTVAAEKIKQNISYEIQKTIEHIQESTEKNIQLDKNLTQTTVEVSSSIERTQSDNIDEHTDVIRVNDDFEPKINTIIMKEVTTEIRETHITTVDSPMKEKSKIDEITKEHDIVASSFRIEEIKYDTGLDEIQELEEEDRCSPSSKLTTSSCTIRPRTPEEVQKIVAEVAEVLKSDKELTDIIPDFDEAELERRLSQKSDDTGLGHRMLLTASSEDGGGETEINTQETTLVNQPQSPELSGKSSPEIRVDLAPDIDQNDMEINAKSEQTPLSSFEEKEKQEVSEKSLAKHDATTIEKERNDSFTFDREEPDRRESTYSTFSEKDMTQDESSIEEQKSLSSPPLSTASHISDIKQETQNANQQVPPIQETSDKFPVSLDNEIQQQQEKKSGFPSGTTDDQSPDCYTDEKPLDSIIVRECRSKSVSALVTNTPYKLEREFLDDSIKLPVVEESINSSHESLVRSTMSIVKEFADLTKFPVKDEVMDSSPTEISIENITVTQKHDRSLTPEPDSSVFSGKQSPDVNSKSADVSLEKGKSNEGSDKSFGTLERDSIDGSHTTGNTTIEKDSLSLDSSKTGFDNIEANVSVPMQIFNSTIVEHTSATTGSTNQVIDDLKDRKTPPTAPISPNIKTDTTQNESIEELHKELQSTVSSIHGSTESIAKSIPMSTGGQGSGIETPESSPKPTAPFPKGLDTVKPENYKISSEMATSDMTHTYTSDETIHVESTDTVVSITKTLEPTTTLPKNENTIVSEKASTVQIVLQEEKSITVHKSNITENDSEDEGACSAMSTSPQPPASPYATKFNFETEISSDCTGNKLKFDDIDESQYEIPPQYDTALTLCSPNFKPDPMNTSFYGSLPEVEKPKTEETHAAFSSQFVETVSSPVEVAEFRHTTSDKYFDEADLDFDKVMTSDTENKDRHESKEKEKKAEETLASWGKPLGLPSPALTPAETENRTTPKKERKQIAAKTKLNNEKNLRKRGESPASKKRPAPVYVELAYVPHHGNSYYSHVEYFRRIRARYYVFSGTEPSREVFNALLEAKQTWEDKELEVTIIPTYDTDVLGYWVSENEELLSKYHIDLSPSAARCTINLQDHETSCSAYRLEF